MSGSSLDGLDIVFAELNENAGKWEYEILASDCYEYPVEWKNKLADAINLNGRDYLLLHAEYGHYLGKEVNRFIQNNGLEFKVGLIASHGHTSFHLPAQKMTAQLGEGAAIAAVTALPVVSDLRALDVAFGGQGAPIVPIGEQLLFPQFDMFLNIGGIANISFNLPGKYTAFDVCPANRVLNLLAETKGKSFDEGGKMAASGNINNELLYKLNSLEYYSKPFPKSLANSFGTDEIFPLVQSSGLPVEDALRTYVEHIAFQINNSVDLVELSLEEKKLMVTGGGALNNFLIERLSEMLSVKNIKVVVPETSLVNNKEALVMALIGVLRWRQEYNVLSTVTGAARNNIGGAVWIGQEA